LLPLNPIFNVICIGSLFLESLNKKNEGLVLEEEVDGKGRKRV
jgi:hypothetical protein